MLNKFLCWMWGCQFDQFYAYHIKELLNNNKEKRISYILKFPHCKHCGARKHDY